MKTAKRFCWMALCAAVLVFVAGPNAKAQTTEVRSRIVKAVDDTQTLRLQGNVHPLARPVNDQGALADSQPMTRMLLLLQRSTEQEMALRQLMDAQQTKGSGNYHAWLTPEQFGKQYGPSDADVQAVTDWLTKQGFQVSKVAAGRTVIEFGGNVGLVRNAFHTEIHRYVVNGEEHFANASDPAIPVALAPVVAGVVALYNFPRHSQLRRVGTFQRDTATGQIRPLFTYTDHNGTSYAVGPADFAKIYNISSTATGAGQSIAIVGQSNINLQDVADFRTMFGLPANQPTVILNGPDPGIIGPNTNVFGSFPDDEQESDLDVEWSGAVAPQAQIILVTSQTPSTTVSNGVDLSALYIVDNNVAPVMSDSYGSCEAALGTTGNAFYSGLWEQAAAEGITVSVAAGDNGSAECDPLTNPNAATQGLAVDGLASTPFNVAVGGTDFDQFSNPTNYWNTTNTATTQLSAKGYIAETVWDDSTCAANYLANPVTAPCTSVDPSGVDLHAGGGGPSNCAISTTTTCTAGYPKPAFQSALTPADGVRDTPDISLFASDGFNGSFYIICQSDSNANGARCDLSTSSTSTPATENFSGVGGTSVGAPTFAAIMALVNQNDLASGGSGRQGNANYVLYLLAAKSGASCNSSAFTNPASPPPSTCIFYDITKGTNTVACVAGTPNCSNTGTSGFGVLTSGVGVDNGNPAFKAVSGYDLATGLGSINVANLLTNWTSAVRTTTTTTIGALSTSSGTSGQSFTVPVSVAPPAAAGDVSITALASDGTTVLGSFGPFTLSAGVSVNAITSLLPPGTAFLTATYGGSATYAVSTSAPPTPVSISGTNQASKTTLSFVTFDSSRNPVLSTGSQSVQYGSSYILKIAVTPTSGTPCTNGGTLITPGMPCPVGTIALTDNGSALNDWPNAQNANATNIAKLNNQGFAEDQPIQLGVGSHSLVASFTPSSVNTNYQASTSNSLSVAITQADSSTLVLSTLSSVTKGTSVTLTAYVTTLSSGVGPTGSMQFSNGGTSLGSATCTPTSGAANTNPPISQSTAGTAFCTATLTTAISGLYPPPERGPGPRGKPVLPWIVALASAVLFALGWRWMPAARRRAYAYAGLIAFALLAAGIAACGGGGSGSSGTGPGQRTINAVYPGDTNYKPSNGSVTITVM
jgi:Pro-kumamolisin, activation domain